MFAHTRTRRSCIAYSSLKQGRLWKHTLGRVHMHGKVLDLSALASHGEVCCMLLEFLCQPLFVSLQFRLWWNPVCEFVRRTCRRMLTCYRLNENRVLVDFWRCDLDGCIRLWSTVYRKHDAQQDEGVPDLRAVRDARAYEGVDVGVLYNVVFNIVKTCVGKRP